MRSHLGREIRRMRSHLGSEIQQVRSDLGLKIQTLDAKLDILWAELGGRMDGLEDGQAGWTSWVAGWTRRTRWAARSTPSVGS